MTISSGFSVVLSRLLRSSVRLFLLISAVEELLDGSFSGSGVDVVVDLVSASKTLLAVFGDKTSDSRVLFSSNCIVRD